MALWQKGLTDPDIMVRRYQCPQCSSYTLHIKHESFAECESGCFIIDSAEIERIIESKNYEGVFTEDDLKYNFI